MAKTFLTARWEKLIMANYVVDPTLLEPHLPAGTALDSWKGQCLVSLVGFMFMDTRILGIPVPFHRNFEEVNLRFYVKHKSADGEWRRGVVFIRELVPKRTLTFVANTLYGEHYRTVPMRHSWKTVNNLEVSYDWKVGQQWNRLFVEAEKEPEELSADSEEAFIAEHYWGYTQLNAHKSSQYKVEHPPWRVHKVLRHAISVDIEANYGKAFVKPLREEPQSVFLAEGSEIIVLNGERI